MVITTRSAILDEDACWRLLRTVEVGRLCFTESAMPVIRPVPFMVEDAGVVVALSLALTPHRTFARPTIVAFEADEWTPAQHRGWSVQVVGRAFAMPELDAARFAEQGLTSWINGGPALYVQVTGGMVTGQRTVG